MTEVEYEKLSVFYKMLSDNTRLRILDVLLEESLCVNDICNKLNMSQSAISHQLINLRKENLVKTNKIGKNVYYSIADKHVEIIIRYGKEHIMEEVK